MDDSPQQRHTTGLAVGEGWQVLKIGGIPLRLQPSWLFAVAIFTTLFQSRYASTASVTASWGLGLLTTLLLFSSVLLHELGHALMALREGVKVLSITLFHLGGIARVEKECPTAMGNLRIAAAGPIVSLVLAFGMLAGAAALSDTQPLATQLLSQVGLLNLMLGLFNLLPGLPLDGGLILKALVWKLSGSQQKGVQVASASGRALSMLMILLGGVLLWQGWGAQRPPADVDRLVRLECQPQSDPDAAVADGAEGVEGGGCGRQTFPRAGGGSDLVAPQSAAADRQRGGGTCRLGARLQERPLGGLD